MDEKLAAYETDLIKNLYHNKECLPIVFERININQIQKENEVVKAVFWAIATLWKEEKTISKISVESKALSVFRGDVYSIEAFVDLISSSKPQNEPEENIEYILNEWKRKTIVKISRRIYDLANKKNVDFNDIYLYLEKGMEIIGKEDEIEEDPEDILIPDSMIEFEKPFLKRLFKGILRGNITTIAGDTGHTKTTLSIFMVNEWIEQGYKVIVFSVEMSYKEFFQKLISLRTRINSNLIVENVSNDKNEFGKLTEEEYSRIKEEIKHIKEKFIATKKLIVKDKITDVAEMRLWIRKEKPDVVLIDPIQGMDMPEGELNKNMAFGIPTILKSLKKISKQVNCAIVLVAWMSTDGKRPITSMMYASKAMDRWSAKIWMLYYFYKVKQIPAFRNVIEIIDGKNRFGDSGIKLVSVIPEYGIYDKIRLEPHILDNYKKVTKL